MTLVSGICFFLAIAAILSMFAQRTDVLSPARLFLIVWAVAIGLADLKLSLYQAQWSGFFWLVLLSGIAAMFTGMFVSYVVHMNRPWLPISEVRETFTQLSVNERVLFRLALGMFCIYLVSFFAEVAIMGGVPYFSARPDVARVKFGVFGIHLLVTSLPVAFYLIVQYFLFIRGNRAKKWILAAAFAIGCITWFTLLARFLFVTSALLVLGLTYYASRRIRIRHLLTAGAVFAGMLLIIRSTRLSKYAENFFEIVSRMKYGKSPGLFIEPYMYVSMNLENFARAVDKLDSFMLGYFTADPILALTGLKHWLAESYGIIERPFLTSGYNTYPFFWTYYYDFGPLGTVLIPLLLGAAIGAAHARVRIQPGLVALALYACGIYFIVIGFITNPLTMLGIATDIVLLVVLQWYLSVRSA